MFSLWQTWWFDCRPSTGTSLSAWILTHHKTALFTLLASGEYFIKKYFVQLYSRSEWEFEDLMDSLNCTVFQFLVYLWRKNQATEKCRKTTTILIFLALSNVSNKKWEVKKNCRCMLMTQQWVSLQIGANTSTFISSGLPLPGAGYFYRTSNHLKVRSVLWFPK